MQFGYNVGVSTFSIIFCVVFRKEKQKILKNLLVICIAFLLNFISFGGTSSLQSSLNDDEGLGTGSLAIIYGALIVSATLTPSFCTIVSTVLR